MKQLVSVNLTTRAAKDWTPPELTFGESLTLALRFFKNTEGQEIEANLTVDSLKASIGEIDARPRGGKFAIRIGAAPSTGSNTTAALELETKASELAAALNAVPAHSAYGAARVVFTDGSWLIFFGDQTQQVPMTVVSNSLWPVSFGRITAWQVDGKWVHELRLVQAPVAFTSASDVVLPPQPAISRIQAGVYYDTYQKANEIQQLYIPPEFRGAYVLKRGYGKTKLLSREDGIDVVQEALQVLGKDCFKVTLPLSNKLAIEFIGDYAAAPQDLLEVVVEQAPPGDLTFTIALDRAELAAYLRRVPSVTLPLEIRMVATDDGDFTNEQVALTLPVVINRPVIWAELAERPVVDWLRPTSPKDYVPFSVSQVLTGQQQAFSQVVGDGEATSFVIDHGLASDLCQIVVCENTRPGRVLRDNEYTVTLEDDNSLTLSGFAETPTSGQYAIFVVAIGPESVFQSHTHSIAQITGLQDILDNFGSRIENLESVLPSTGPAATATQASGIEIALPEIKDVLFFKGKSPESRDADLKAAWGADGLDVSKLGRAPFLLPAVHDASPTSYTSGALPAFAADSVWSNDSSVVLDMGRGIYGGRVAVGGFFASDGRVRFAVTRQGTTKSYYPTGFDRELWRIFINDKMLRLNRTLDVQFAIALQLVAATSNAQWILVIEKGTAPQQSTPATTGTNLENVVWDATPILSQRLIVTSNRQTHTVGTRIKRSLVSLADTITCDTMLYGVWEGADSVAPASANFALRARLVQFDTENAIGTGARGWIALELLGAGESKPKAVIK